MNQEETRNSGSTVFTSLVTTLESATTSMKASNSSDGRKSKRKKTDEEVRADVLQQLESCWRETGAGCWEWTGDKKSGFAYAGIARFQQRSGFTSARASLCMYESKTGKKLPKGYRVYMTCKNDMCVRFEHMVALTLSQYAQQVRIAKPGTAWVL